MAKGKRQALRTLPAYDLANNIGAVDRVRWAVGNDRTADLTVDERLQLDRWRQINDWIRDRYYTKGDDEIAIRNHRTLRNLVKENYGVSWETAERLIKNTKVYFTNLQDDQEYYRSVYIEQLEQHAADAASQNEYGAAARLIELAAKLRGLLEKPVEDIPYDKLTAFQFIIEYNPEAIGLKRIENPDEVMERWRKKRTLSQKMADQADDAEYV